jgi:hypothetical protein
MNLNQFSKPAEIAVSQRKPPRSLFSYLILGLIGVWLYPRLFGNPTGSEIEI